MTDRKLLEAAAKAAGIEHPGGEHSIANDGRLWDCNGLRWWNPLTDDGDALRLAVKLGLSLGPNFDGELAVCFARQGADFTEEYGSDQYAATRRAIVRAAAAIGRKQP